MATLTETCSPQLCRSSLHFGSTGEVRGFTTYLTTSNREEHEDYPSTGRHSLPAKHKERAADSGQSVTLFHSSTPVILSNTAQLWRAASKQSTSTDASAAALLFRSQSCYRHEHWEAAGRAAWLSGQMQTACMMWSPLLVQRQALQQCVLPSTSHANAAETIANFQNELMIYQKCSAVKACRLRNKDS